MNPDQPRGGAGEMEMERAEVESRVRAAITRNREILRATPDNASDEEFWSALHREGQPRKISVRRVDGGAIDTQDDIYLLNEEDGHVEMTYFRQGDEVGESFWVALDRVVAIE